MKRLVIRVVPYQKNNGWVLKGAKLPAGQDWFESKLDAIDEGRRQAKIGNFGQLVIYGRNGRIQTEHTYGKDPKRHRG